MKAPRAKSGPRKQFRMHPELKRALAGNRKAAATLEALSPSHKREYLERIWEAKRDETRSKRIAQALKWLAESKPRNWKYMRP